MPRIINAYDGNSALGDTLSKLGEAIYGDQSKNEVYRQKAFSQKNINDLVTDAAVGLDDPRLAKAQLGIGGTAAGTFPGQGRALANDRFTNAATNAAGERNNVRNNAETHYSTDRQYQGHIDTTRMNNDTSIKTTGMNNDTSIKTTGMNNDTTRDVQLAIDARTMVPVSDGKGGFVYAQKSNAAGQGAPMSVDQVKAGVISQALQQRAASMQPQASPFTTGAPAWNASAPAPQQPAAAPQGDIFAGMTPQVRELAGVNTVTPMLDPRSGQTGVSRDSGTTLENGQPATGYIPTTNEGRIAQERDNNVRTQAGTALSLPDPAKSQAAADASQASGLGAKVQKLANEELGAIPGGSSILKATTGSPEIAPGTQRAQSQLDIRNNAARSVLLGAPGRQTVQAQQWVNELLPQGSAMANPATEANKIPTIVNALKADYAQIQQTAMDPNTLPADRVKMVQQLRQIENSIRLFTEPAAGAPQQPAAPAAAPAQQASAPQADPLAQAREAIARGADPAAVAQRLQQNGIDPSGLATPMSR